MPGNHKVYPRARLRVVMRLYMLRVFHQLVRPPVVVGALVEEAGVDEGALEADRHLRTCLTHSALRDYAQLASRARTGCAVADGGDV